jgi:hypothetical protein
LGRGRPTEKTSSEDQAQPRESEERFFFEDWIFKKGRNWGELSTNSGTAIHQEQEPVTQQQEQEPATPEKNN